MYTVKLCYSKTQSKTTAGSPQLPFLSSWDSFLTVTTKSQKKHHLPLSSMVVVEQNDSPERDFHSPNQTASPVSQNPSPKFPKNLSERTFYLLLDVPSLLPTSTFLQSVMGRIHLTTCKEVELDIHPWASHPGLPSWSVEIKTCS